jgi:anti-sigma regulatory factor (Ser/Thr protein kinase)
MTTFVAKLDQLPAMLAWVREQCASPALPVKKIELAMEEILVNIISYAYPAKPGQIHLSCEHLSDALRFTIKDQGIPFNPLDHPEPPPTPEKPGGLGIHFAKSLLTLKYERHEPYNVLTLIYSTSS